MDTEKKTIKTEDPVKTGLEKIAVLGLFALVAVFAYVKIWDTDVWWHLAAGKLLVEKQKIPEKDPFSFTASNKKWVNDEWLGDVYLYSAYKKWGYSGLQSYSVAISLLICLLLYSIARSSGANPMLSAALPAGAFWAARVRLTNHRPEMFALLFIATAFFLVNLLISNKQPESGPNQKRRIIAVLLIPILQVFWVNFHPSATFSLLLIFLALISSVLVFFADWKLDLGLKPQAASKSVRTLGILLVVTAAATLVNPYGLHGLAAPFEFAKEKSFLIHIAEWAPIPWKRYFMLQDAPGRMGLPIFLTVGIASFLINRRKMNLFHSIVFILTAYMAFRSRRFIAVFCLLSAPAIAINLSPLFERLFTNRKLYMATAASLIVLAVATGWFDGVKGTRFPWGTGIKQGALPETAMRFIKENSFEKEMFNSYSFGGALIWRLFPERKVFIDGRIPLYGGDFYNEYLQFEANPSSEMWNRLQEKYNLNFAVLKISGPENPAAIRNASGEWQTVFWDSAIIIMAKTIPGHETVIRKYSYKFTDPFTAIDRASEWESFDKNKKYMIRTELERSLETSPDNIIAIRALTFIALKEEDYGRAMSLAEHGLEIAPGIAGLHAVRGTVLLDRGDRTGALKAFRSAAALAPEYRNIVRQLEQGKIVTERRRP